MKRILFTGFEPFANFAENPSEKVIKGLETSVGTEFADFMILDCKWNSATKQLIDQLETNSYDYVISVGLAAKRTKICLEEKYYNEQNCSLADNEGIVIENQSINQNGPDFYITELSNKIYDELQLNHPISLSDDAGRFLCNHISYSIMNYIEKESLRTSFCFVHIPEEVDLDLDKTLNFFEDLYNYLKVAR